MTAHGFNLALEKTEVVILTKKRIPTESIELKLMVKYVGLNFDSKMSIFEQIKRTANKAAALVLALSRLMTNTGSPTSQSVLLSGAEVWADALGKEVYRRRLAQMQRREALRVMFAYQTISEPAGMVIVGVIPVAFLAKERKAIYKRKGEDPREVVAREKRQRILDE